MDRQSSAAAQLAEQLKQQQLTSFQLLVGLPRSQVDMLTLQLPPATATELPEMVRNEVTRQLSDLPEDSPIDFCLVRRSNAKARRRSLRRQHCAAKRSTW